MKYRTMSKVTSQVFYPVTLFLYFHFVNIYIDFQTFSPFRSALRKCAGKQIGTCELLHIIIHNTKIVSSSYSALTKLNFSSYCFNVLTNIMILLNLLIIHVSTHARAHTHKFKC